jgi:hypothetical protein
MKTNDLTATLTTLFSELVLGARNPPGAFILNTGDVGLLRSLDKLSEDDASRSSLGGATIAAHALHLTYGLALMNQWARDGSNPFADAKWDEAWKTARVDAREWSEIRRALGDETKEWLEHLETPREVDVMGLNGMVASIAHLAYHLGAIRQIDKSTRGPKEGSYASAAGAKT